VTREASDWFRPGQPDRRTEPVNGINPMGPPSPAKRGSDDKIGDPTPAIVCSTIGRMAQTMT
jgi:hypothetical protein